MYICFEMRTKRIETLKIIETPRDAFQGVAQWISTEKKIEYCNALIRSGFDIVEVGSFVSEEVIPQMKDTADVLKGLICSDTSSEIMVLAANKKGADMAMEFDVIRHIAYPFSASETFLRRNINRSIDEARKDMDAMLNGCLKCSKNLVVYLTMAFGNPYHDPWHPEIIAQLVEMLQQMGIQTIPLSDITGEADVHRMQSVFNILYSSFSEIEFGLHLHSHPEHAITLVDAAWQSGCRRFDTVLSGMGGCPMTGKELLSNLDTLALISYFDERKIPHAIQSQFLSEAKELLNHINND